mgnify:CR=1 FL=1
MNDDLTELILGIVLLVIVAGGLLVGGKWVSNTCFDNIPSRVMVDGKLIYEGKSYGFDSDSQGYATRVIVYGGPFYFFPQKVYVSKDVVIEGSK